MLKIIPNKKNIGAELVCDLNKINNSSLKKNKICSLKIWDDLF